MPLFFALRGPPYEALRSSSMSSFTVHDFTLYGPLPIGFLP